MNYIFGATGYIGRYLCVHLKELGVPFTAIGRSEKVRPFFEQNGIPLEIFDLSGPVKPEERFPAVPGDAIINLAACLAEHETPVERFFEVNTLGTQRLLEFARVRGVKKVVVTSSHKVYNDVDVPPGTPISEETPPRYRGDHTPYIISKIAAEHFVEYYNKDFGLKGICLRLTGVHGYGEILGHLNPDGSYRKSTFEIFFEKALRGDPIEVWGNQSIRRDHIYVKDVLGAIIAAVRAPDASGIFNIAMGRAYSQYEEACALADVFAGSRRSTVTARPDLPGLVRGYLYDISKARAQLHWKPAFTDLHALYADYKAEWQSKRFHNYHFIRPEDRPATL